MPGKTAFLSATASILIAAASVPVAAQETGSSSNPDELDFSLSNMDRSVDPADDFYRYAAGGWLDRVERPDDMNLMAFMTLVMKRMDKQILDLVKQAAAKADTAKDGTPTQQIGTLYNTYMNVDAINAAGLAPLQPELDRLDAVSSKDELAAYLGHFALITGKFPLMEIEVFEGITNAKMSEVYAGPGELSQQYNAFYEKGEGSTEEKAFIGFVADTLEVGGVPKDAARNIAADTLAIEKALHAGKSDPVAMLDYRNWNNRRSAQELDTQAGAFPVETYLQPLELNDIETIIVTHKDYPSAVAKVWADYSLDQLKGYMKFRLLQSFAGALSTDFEQPTKNLNAALGVSAKTPPREDNAILALRSLLAQPLGKLYVDTYFAPETSTKGEDMIRRIQAEFRKRIEANEWLDNSTRAEALNKVNGFYYKVGLPDRWIDYSGVEIGDDMVQNVININRFWIKRSLAGAGKPFERWTFSSPDHTAPVVVNAAYNPSANGFEVTAAIAQAPAFQTDMDAPIYFCRLGAVIGHEMTHGFDSGGRLFDHNGSLRNWFTDDDADYFENQAKRLVAQGDTFEPRPGQFMKGALTVKENLADVGGVSLAYDALMTYLEEHPEENVEIDGLTPTQRCFIAWAQLWAEKIADQLVPMQLQDVHAPGPYRTYAPLQHLDAFYDAFDIKEGDPMWLPPEERVRVW